MRIVLITLLAVATLVGAGCAYLCCSVDLYENIDYGSNVEGISVSPTLNVFAPDIEAAKLPVVIFVHGGNWNSGSKNTYNMIGRNFARNEMVTVIPDYTKSPKANYDQMAQQIAQTIQWTQENIESYGGDPKRIFIIGHSAGGHLSALAVMKSDYGIVPGTIKGMVLNDAAGLDMGTYLKENPPTSDTDYITTWSDDPTTWENASPINYISPQTPPILSYLGTQTYNSILTSNQAFQKKLQTVQPSTQLIELEKGHTAMVTQLFWPWNDRFTEIKEWMLEQP